MFDKLVAIAGDLRRYPVEVASASAITSPFDVANVLMHMGLMKVNLVLDWHQSLLPAGRNVMDAALPFLLLLLIADGLVSGAV